MPVTLYNSLMSDELIWNYPQLSILSDSIGKPADRGGIKSIASIIEKTLFSYKLHVRVKEVNLGASITQYALEVAEGTRISDILAHTNDLALATSAPTGKIHIEAPIPGRNLIGIEIVNKTVEIVPLHNILSSKIMLSAKSKLTLSLGQNKIGAPVITDLGKLPHMIIAGSTGTGKTNLINTFISTLLFRASPAEVRMILVDTK